MAEATFLPSTAYGLDPLSIAQKVATTGATIAQTQAARQSMAERAQMMRLRQEEAQREQAQYQYNQWHQEVMRPAVMAKAQADVSNAQAQSALATQKYNRVTEWNTVSKSFGDRFNQIRSIADDGERANQLNGFASQVVPYMEHPEAKALQDAAAHLSDLSWNAYIKSKEQKATLERYEAVEKEKSARASATALSVEQYREASEQRKLLEGNLISIDKEYDDLAKSLGNMFTAGELSKEDYSRRIMLANSGRNQRANAARLKYDQWMQQKGTTQQPTQQAAQQEKQPEKKETSTKKYSVQEGRLMLSGSSIQDKAEGIDEAHKDGLIDRDTALNLLKQLGYTVK